MTESRNEWLKRVGARTGLYVATGIVIFTVIRLAFLEFDVAGWNVSLVALGCTLLVLEVMTRIGWLSKPIGREEGA